MPRFGEIAVRAARKLGKPFYRKPRKARPVVRCRWLFAAHFAGRFFKQNGKLAARAPPFLANSPTEPASWAQPGLGANFGRPAARYFRPEIEKVFSDENFFLDKQCPAALCAGPDGAFLVGGFHGRVFSAPPFLARSSKRIGLERLLFGRFFKKNDLAGGIQPLGQLREIWQKPPRYSPISPHNIDRLCGRSF